MPPSAIQDHGISIIYQPAIGNAVVDILVIHGLQGHPYKTWARKLLPADNARRLVETPKPDKGGRSKSFRRIIPLFTKRQSNSGHPGYQAQAESSPALQALSVFWPEDLLPEDFPSSRIMVYGYDTQVTQYNIKKSTNKNGVYQHAKDLLFAIARERVPGRPIVFIAHSLGGIVVKDMLAQSSASSDSELQDIVGSTKAVLFLGTPHRGSPDLAALGEWARSVLSLSGRETNSAILDALGLRTADLERAQDAFSQLWNKHGFRVKTFQESLGLTGIDLGVLGNKVVPNSSSLLGDSRERAETIQGNHMDMCRFIGREDTGYRKLTGELRSTYNELVSSASGAAMSHQLVSQSSPALVNTKLSELPHSTPQDQEVSIEAFKEKIGFPSVDLRYQNIERPAGNTCEWLFRHNSYEKWFNCGQGTVGHRPTENLQNGLLWLKGSPGTGKSTLMKEAFSRAAREQPNSDYLTAAFFFNAKGETLDHSATGLFRSLLLQLLPYCADEKVPFLQFLNDQSASNINSWREADLQILFESVIAKLNRKRIIIFIDALDECDSYSLGYHVEFWRDLVSKEHCNMAILNVCISSRKYPHVGDIAAYVDWKLSLRLEQEAKGRSLIREGILSKAGGVFLWASLVLDDLLKQHDRGRSLQYLHNHLNCLPEELDDLYTQILNGLDAASKPLALRLFQWATLAITPLRIHEWHHILAFIQKPAPSSLSSWKNSENFTDDDDQLIRRLRAISCGLIEVCTVADYEDDESEKLSVRAGAGSLDLEHGQTRVVQVIHESVRDYFLRGRGFSALGLITHTRHAIGQGHLSIMNTCLDYLNITELDALVQARLDDRTGNGQDLNLRKNSPTVPVVHDLFTSYYQEQTTLNSQLGRSSPRGVKRRASVASFGSASSHGFGADSPATPVFHDGEQSPIPNIRVIESDFPRERGQNSYGPSRNTEMNVELWVRASQAFREVSPSQSTALSPASLFSGVSQVLEDFPALLSYAMSAMFVHARQAEDSGADPTFLVQRLSKLWPRWKALKEDISHQTGLLYYAADQGLSSWQSQLWGSATQAMQEAVCRKHYQALDFLLEHTHRAFSLTYIQKKDILPWIIEQGDCYSLRIFLGHASRWREGWLPTNSYSLVDESNLEGQTPLQTAVMKCNLDAVSILLQHGANVNAIDTEKRTALHIACFNKPGWRLDPSCRKLEPQGPHCAIVALLIRNGASVNSLDNMGRTPLYGACYGPFWPEQEDNVHPGERPSGTKEFSCQLAQASTNAAAQNRDGQSPCRDSDVLHTDECRSKLHVVAALLDRGAHINSISYRSETPLHMASFWQDIDVVRHLLHQGANVLAKDCDGRQPVHNASWSSSPEVVEELLRHMAQSVDSQDACGCTPLQLACHPASKANREGRGLGIIRTLLGKGAKGWTIANNEGYNAFHIAKHFNFSEAMDLLVDLGCDSPGHGSNLTTSGLGASI
ncbi:hypothetical protein JX266_004095 [Neoarthrinium moseri]|nr:hypothetical protein JX266_004095 [Neoarthrinium moseri]